MADDEHDNTEYQYVDEEQNDYALETTEDAYTETEQTENPLIGQLKQLAKRYRNLLIVVAVVFMLLIYTSFSGDEDEDSDFYHQPGNGKINHQISPATLPAESLNNELGNSPLDLDETEQKPSKVDKNTELMKDTLLSLKTVLNHDLHALTSSNTRTLQTLANMQRMVNNRNHVFKDSNTHHDQQLHALTEQVSALNTVIQRIEHKLVQLEQPKKVHRKTEKELIGAKIGFDMAGRGILPPSNPILNKPAAPVKHNTPSKLRYNVEACLNGRAWLRDSHGNTLTVSIGDIIPGYGAIVAIDSVNTLVSTSSGSIFRPR